MPSRIHGPLALAMLLALTVPATAQQPSDTPASPAKPAAAPDTPPTPAADPPPSKEEEAAKAITESWTKGRPISMQYFRPTDKRGLNLFETTKDKGVGFTGFKLGF